MKHLTARSRRILSLMLIPAAVIYVSCSSLDYNETMQKPEMMFYEGNYKEAARTLLPAVNSGGKNRLLFMMECGYMLHAGQEYETSNSVLLPAGKEAIINTVSVSEQTSSLLTNNTALTYKGEDFEKVLIHMYLGINYLMLGDSENAGVEFKRVNEELEKAKDENGTALYKQNLMAKYLTAAAFEAIGEEHNDMDDIEYAYTELKQINQLRPGLDSVQTDLQRLSKRLGYDDDYRQWINAFGRKDAGTENSGELVLIFQSGLSAVKKSRGKLLADVNMNTAVNASITTVRLTNGLTAAGIIASLGLAENPIPYFEKRADNVSHVQIAVKGKTAQTVMMEDISATAVQNFNDDYSRLCGKVAAAIVTKAAASIAAGLAAKALAQSLAKNSKNANGIGSLIGTLVGSGTSVALFANMKPDLRCWHTLPAKLHLGRIFLPEGQYTAKLRFIGQNGNISTKNVDIAIKKGKKTFITERTMDNYISYTPSAPQEQAE